MRTDRRVSTFISNVIRLAGEKLDFEMYDAFKLPYEVNERRVMLLAGRQVGKTIYLASKLSTKSILYPNNRAMYVAPLESHVKSFSKTKLQAVIDSTPELKAVFSGHGAQSDVFFKKNKLGAYIELTYASLGGQDPVRIRGKSADDLYLDETQDIDFDTLPAIEEVTTSSKMPVITYAGTAKGVENTTGVIWERSNKIERMIFCRHCRKWNIIGRENISKDGLVCNNPACRKRIYIEDARWFATGNKDADFIAFRIPQVVLKFHNQPEKWEAVWEKYVNYHPEKFNQEVLAIPSGASTRMVTMDVLKKKCTGGKMVYTPSPDWMRNYHGFFMGIDWTGDGVLQKSRTVAVVIGHRKDGKFQMVWGKIFPPGMVHTQHEELTNIAQLFRCSVVGADYGMGQHPNAQMMESLGANRFRQVQYIMSDDPFRFDFDRMTIRLGKTQAIDTIMMMFVGKWRPKTLTNGKPAEFIFPEFSDSKPFLEDILAEYEEETRHGKKIWTHSPMKPDDSLHAIVFGMYAYMHYRNAVTFY